MHKIPTMFGRGADFKVKLPIREDCRWVIRGEGVATEKLDGTNIRLTVRSGQLVRIEKRRNPTKAQKAQGITNGWYVDTHPDDPSDEWIREAAANTSVSDWWDGEYPCEALGPKIQGNPLGLVSHIAVRLSDAPTIPIVGDMSFDHIREWVLNLDSVYSPGHPAEGIVFHHPDGRMAKIKRKDFA